MMQLPIDERRLHSIISDIKMDWRNGADMEYMAIEWAIQKFHERILEGK